MKIGQQLKEQRNKAGLTQVEVANRILVSSKSISNWENGNNFPDIESLIRLSKLYNISLDDILLEGSDIVDDIKEKQKFKSFSLVYILGLLTSSLAFFILTWGVDFTGFSAKQTVFLSVVFILLLISNSVLTIYFTNQMKYLRGRYYSFMTWFALIFNGVIATISVVLFIMTHFM
ncbi:helix-turn-helix domain-containing protein [Pediococcus argentinicus]|uniref:HTH cro/C1-type domain-containing protein n=1 Tax=Pediococcus argentinicus TaxID=480391 RepID=A0A0R2NJW2_9LACO|nr:helix-turn-helix transcriptional regulator [Pediococcus argentinicus]KRO26057.1 hypothetical protein IV88_GL000971 [Pediococcus argentinicus]NKZ21718.1 helix-turn-helix transcriptional regulator [Pediococcus argentinicus]GEP18880.1 hypothetical protein LSA03_02640 [Pediococcus argentinicus]